MAVGANGHVYVADKGHRSTWEVRPDGSTVSIRGPENDPNYPRGVAANPLGEVYIAIATKHPLFGPGYVFPIQGWQDSARGFGTQTYGNPYGVAIDPTGTTVFVVDPAYKVIDRYQWTVTNNNTDYWKFTHLGKKFVDPYGVATDPRSLNVYVADAGGKDVWEGSPAGWAEVGKFSDPYGVAVDAGGTLYVADPGSKDVWKLTR